MVVVHVFVFRVSLVTISAIVDLEALGNNTCTLEIFFTNPSYSNGFIIYGGCDYNFKGFEDVKDLNKTNSYSEMKRFGIFVYCGKTKVRGYDSVLYLNISI